MSAREFALHQAYLRRVPSGAEGALHRWASTMAAILNGPSTRKDKRRWIAADFAGDLFAPPKPVQPAGPSVGLLKAFVSGLRRR